MVGLARQRYERLGLLLFVLVSVRVKSTMARTTIDYALQVRPVSFLQEPTSSAVLVGSSVTFGCNVSIAPLISDYPLPNLTWRVNGSMDTSTQSSWQIRPNSSEDGYNYFSELYIENVSAEDAGYYECVSSDGGGRYVTISSRAWLTVISVNPVAVVQLRQVVAGSPLLLSCDTGATIPPEQVQWFREGIQLSHGSLSGEWDILSNGSLLVFSVSQEDAGNYSCTGWITGYPLNSSNFDITITEGASSQSPQLLVDPNRAQPTARESLNLTCYIVGETNTTDVQIRWMKDEEAIATTNGVKKFVLQLETSDASDTGVYTCEVVMNGMALQANANVTVTFPPTISGEHVQDAERVRNGDRNNIVELSCDVTGSPTPTIYWYKNGQDVSQQSVQNTTTGRTNYTARGRDSSGLLGIYQCFAVNRAGVAYRIFRVLEFDFANPPGNLTCSLTLNRTGRAYTSWIILNWTRPSLSPNPPSSYSIEYERVHTIERYRSDLPFLKIEELELVEGIYQFSVRVDRGPGEHPRLPPSKACRLDTAFDAKAEDTMWPLSVLCQGRTNIHVEWLNPTFPFDSVYVQSVHLNGTCLYGNRTDLKFQMEGSDYDDYEYAAAEKYTLSVPTRQVPNGAVCLFGGHYSFDRDAITVMRVIPTEHCIIPAKKAPIQAVQLGLSCDSSIATISWFTSPHCYQVLSFTLHGICFSHDWTRLDYDVLNTTDPAGITTVDGIPNNAICTFYGSYQHYEGETRETDPVQCVMGRDVDPQYRLNTTYNESDCIPPQPETPSATPTTTTTSSAVLSHSTLLPPSPSHSPTSGISSAGFTGHWWAVLGAMGLVAISVFALVMLLLVIKYLKRDKEAEVKQRMADLVAQSFPNQEDAYGPDIHPHKGFDVLSHATECDYLSRPENVTFVTKKSLSSLVEEDGKPHLFTKLFQSQSTGVAWSSCEDINSQGNDHIETDTPKPHDQMPEGSTWCLTDVPAFSECVPVANSAGHQFVRIMNSGGTSSSGYGTENYYLSDTSCGYNTSQHPNSCYGSKFDKDARTWPPLVSVKEELETSNSRTTEQSSATSDPNNLHSEINTNINEHKHNADESVRTTSPETYIPDQDKHTVSLFPLTSIATADSKSTKLHLKLGPQKVQKIKQLEERDSHSASSPLSEFSEYGSRSPHHSAYYTDDEGYVHMDYALPVENTI